MRWVLFALVGLIVAGAGLFLGKMREKDYFSRMYGRRDFVLLDDKDEFFQLQKFPADRLLLLVFTPDGLSPRAVPAFRAFASHVTELRKLGIDVMMVSRTNREVVKNFRSAARFESRLLLDASGTVGRLVGIWPDMEPVSYWGYALLDNQMQVYWYSIEPRPMDYETLMGHLKDVSRKETGKN